jgi:hypothetical protein
MDDLVRADSINGLQDAVELTEIARKEFQEKLDILKIQYTKESDPEQSNQILSRANTLYQEYQDLLQGIEKYIDEVKQEIKR